MQVLANGGVATACIAGLDLLRPRRGNVGVVYIAFAGAYAAATADTWGTEIGTLAAKPPRSILTGNVLATGLSGGVSAPGTAAEVAGAVLIALLTPVALLLALPGTGTTLHVLTLLMLPVFAGGFGGATIDSLLGATLQDRRWCPSCERECEVAQHGCGTATVSLRGLPWLTNDGVNFLATASGAAIAGGIWSADPLGDARKCKCPERLRSTVAKESGVHNWPQRRRCRMADQRPGGRNTYDTIESGFSLVLIAAAVISATLMQTLDTTIVNVALPIIQGNLGATLDEGSWVVTG